MSNPWKSLDLSTPPYVHADDRSCVVAHNTKAKPDYFYDLRLRPEPYIGSLNAKVLLLALNPGLSVEDFEVHVRPDYVRHHQENLFQAERPFPFYYLHPDLDCPGSTWWRAKLKWLIKECGIETASKELCCLQYAPYHSVAYKHRTTLFPSQSFNQQILQHHIEKGLPVIILRSRRYWEELVPELVNYENVVVLRNPRNPTLSPKNMGESNFEKLLQTLTTS